MTELLWEELCGENKQFSQLRLTPGHDLEPLLTLKEERKESCFNTQGMEQVA